MNCKRAKLELALLAGRDLDGAAEEQVRRHLAECPGCREHWQGLEAALPVLQQVSAQASLAEPQPGRDGAQRSSSIWPAVAARLEARPLSIPAPQFPRWVPVTAVAAACLALVVYIQQPRPDGYLEPGGRSQFSPSEDFAELPEHDALLDLLRQAERRELPPPFPFSERSLQQPVRAVPYR